ncbi:MAG: ABC transporter permease, partial [bacterium]
MPEKLQRILDALDPRTTLRALVRAPAFTGAAVLTFALGIGVNAAIFGAANAILLNPLPALDVSRVMALETDVVGGALQHARVAPQEVWELSDRHDVFTAVGGYRLAKVTLRDAGSTDEIDAASTAGGFFEALGARPLLGRLYDAHEVEYGDQHIVVLAHDFWRARFGGDSSVVGRTIVLDDSTFRIVGVLPAGASYPRNATLWTPRPLAFMDLDRSVWASILLTSVARPRAGVNPADVRAALDREMESIYRRYTTLGAMKGVRLVMRPLADAMAGELRPILFAILICGALVLLMACTNVASVQLVRVSALSRELAVRAALGASRWALARQIAAESLLVAAAGGALGVLAGGATIGAIRRSAGGRIASLATIRLDARVVAMLFGLIVLAAAISAIAALRTTIRVDPGDVLRNASRGASAGKRRDRFLRGVVVTQLAVAIVLLLAATTAARSLARLIDVDPGFKAVGATAVRMILPAPRYSPVPSDTSASEPTNVTIFYDQLVSRLRARSNFAAVGLVTGAPFGYVQSNEYKVFIPLAGRPRSPSDPLPDFWRVNDDYFRAMGIPLRAGRAFTATDESHRDPVAIVDDVLARRLFGGKTAVGERLQGFGRIVGVVGSVKKADLARNDDGSLYLPLAPWTMNDLTLVIRSALPAASVAAEVRSAVHELDPTLAIGDVSAMTAGIDRSVAPRRFATRVVASFALLSLILAVVGVCGVMLYGVSQRSKEFGIRLALGASPTMLRQLVLVEGARLAALGLAIGLAAYWLVASLASALVFG